MKDSLENTFLLDGKIAYIDRNIWKSNKMAVDSSNKSFKQASL